MHQGVGVDTLEEEAALSKIKPEGEGARIVMVRVVRVRLAATPTMIAWCK